MPDYVNLKIPEETRENLRQLKEEGNFDTYGKALDAMGSHYVNDVLNADRAVTRSDIATRIRSTANDLERLIEEEEGGMGTLQNRLALVAKDINEE